MRLGLVDPCDPRAILAEFQRFSDGHAAATRNGRHPANGISCQTRVVNWKLFGFWCGPGLPEKGRRVYTLAGRVLDVASRWQFQRLIPPKFIADLDVFSFWRALARLRLAPGYWEKEG